MSCINCNKEFKIKKQMSRYQRPNQLTHKLQDTKWKPGSLKPDLTILGGLEDVSDGVVTLDMLKPHSAHYICHECQIYLRQAVNKKTEVEHHMQVLSGTINKTSDSDRRKYYRENYGKDRQGCCWSCMYQFKAEDYQRPYKMRSGRLNFTAPVVEGMTVSEAITSLFEDKREALAAFLDKKTYICKLCLALLKNVIKTQCVCDTYLTQFTSQTHVDSVYARLTRGENVPYMAQILDEFENSDQKRDPSENDLASPVKSVKDQIARGKKRPFHKTLGVIPFVERPKGKRLNEKKIRTIKKDNDDDIFDDELESDIEEDYDDVDINLPEENSLNNDPGEYTSETNDTLSETDNIEKLPTNQVSGKEELLDEKEKLKKSHNLDKASITEKEDIVNKRAVKSGVKELKQSVVLKTVEVKTHEDGDGKPADTEGVIVEGRNKKTVQIRVKLLGSRKNVQDEKAGEKTVIVTARGDTETREMSDDWVLYYYPSFAGRAEFVRLIFEEAGVPYKEHGEQLHKLIIEGEMEGYPHFAPPMITKGSLQLSQTPVICRYLGEQFGLYPDTLEDRLHAEQVSQCCHDFIAEGRLAFHGINNTASYSTQQQATQPYIDRFKAVRLPRWLKYFERVLKANKDGRGFLYGEKISYADLALFHILHATEGQFPDVYNAADYIPLLKDFKNRIASRPKLAAYLRSDRWRGFCGDSMM